MRKHLQNFFLVTALLICTASTAVAQSTVKGKIVDENNAPLIGATITIPGTTQGAGTDLDGSFTLEITPDAKEIEINYIGYTKVTQAIDGKTANLGVIQLLPGAVSMDEVAIIASIIRSDRQTPIPISNITFEAIEAKISNLEFPELFKTTPSIYVTRGGGGFGDSRINMRGFDSSNLGVLINGVPINGMENGKVYWSNWSGLSDVTEFTQIQRGLGASKMGLSSVGGTMNMVTFGTEAKKGGSFFSGIGNDGYQKTAVSVSTGLMDNGWALTFAGSRTAGDGYVRGTEFEGWSYFGNISKIINDEHKISLTAFGAPQWHNQRSIKRSIQQYKDSPYGGRENNQYGYLNGEQVGGSYGFNEYHKPQISLNHFWAIDHKSSLTTSAYASLAKGGGRRARGNESDWLTIDYGSGNPTASTLMTSDGLLDYDEAYRRNAENPNGSQVIFADDVNDHDWYGLLSSYTTEINDNFSVTGGFDGRYYKGYHFREVTDLLGGEYYMQPAADMLYGDEPNKILHVGDQTGFNNTGEIIWAGVFGQAEYVKDKYSAFLSASFTNETYRYHNPGDAPEALVDGQIVPKEIDVDGQKGPNPAVIGLETTQVSDFVHFQPWSVKGGFNYKFDTQHNVFVNAGYFTRAPYMNAVFADRNISINKGAKYERITTFEVGYGFNNEHWNIAVNAYYTKWMDKFLRQSIGDISANIAGLDALHYGVEFVATYKPTDALTVMGMFSWGDWTWNNNVNFTLFDEETQKPTGTYNAYIKDVHVGNSAQMTAAITVSWEIFENFRINADYVYAGKNFAEFNPETRDSESDAGIDSWQLPDYYTIDLGVNYRLKLTEGLDAVLYTNINNLTNVEYISDADDGTKHDMATARVYYGFGTTWTTGLKILF